MKKTALLFLASLLASTSLFAAPTTNEHKCTFLADAPSQHTVVRGDTLWGISGKFLQNPWCWPQVWGANQEQIKNPHWIYPGQIIYLDRTTGRLYLGINGKDGRKLDDVRLSPQVRFQAIASQALPTIPAGIIEPFLSQPLIVEENELKNTPRIMATQEGRVYLGKGDKAYVRGDIKDQSNFQAFRPGQPLKDPVSKAIIGYEAVYLGTLKLQHAAKTADSAHTFTVAASKEEMGVGDRLLPVSPTPFLNYMPHAPLKTVDARIMSVYGGVNNAGQHQVVTVNRGKTDGLDIGAVLELHRVGASVADRTDDKKMVKLPDEQYGMLFIFRVFNHVAYGLVMQVRDSVQIGDLAKSPN